MFQVERLRNTSETIKPSWNNQEAAGEQDEESGATHRWLLSRGPGRPAWPHRKKWQAGVPTRSPQGVGGDSLLHAGSLLTAVDGDIAHATEVTPKENHTAQAQIKEVRLEQNTIPHNHEGEPFRAFSGNKWPCAIGSPHVPQVHHSCPKVPVTEEIYPNK